MGLTKRQEEMISQIIVEESRAAHESQQERHRILEGARDDEPELLEEAPRVELGPGLKAAVQDLVETFVAGAPLYEGHEFDGGDGVRKAAAYLKRLLENDVREVRQMLADGDFGDEG